MLLFNTGLPAGTTIHRSEVHFITTLSQLQPEPFGICIWTRFTAMINPTPLPTWLLGLLATVSFFVLRTVVSFLRHYRDARKMGIPVICSPIDARHTLWVIFGAKWGPRIRKLPFGLGDWVHYTRFMWVWEDKDEMHRKLGKVFAHVNPGGLVVSFHSLATSEWQRSVADTVPARRCISPTSRSSRRYMPERSHLRRVKSTARRFRPSSTQVCLL